MARLKVIDGCSKEKIKWIASEWWELQKDFKALKNFLALKKLWPKALKKASLVILKASSSAGVKGLYTLKEL